MASLVINKKLSVSATPEMHLDGRRLEFQNCNMLCLWFDYLSPGIQLFVLLSLFCCCCFLCLFFGGCNLIYLHFYLDLYVLGDGTSKT